jgi:TolB-like protein/Tfp pilus assembly protein PilF
MAEEIINALTKIKALRVASRTSSFAFKGKNEDIGEIGQKLKVSTVLEGSVRKMGNRLRITAQLVNVADGFHVWSERYDRDMQDVFTLQDEITARVIDALRPELNPGPTRLPRQTNDVDAYHLYLKGLHFWNKRHEGGLRQGLGAFERAIERDPRYASAYAGLADSYALLGLTLYEGLPAGQSMPKAKAAALKALELDPGLAGPHAALGWVRLHYEWDWPGAEAAFERAIELGPQRATTRHWYSFYLSAMGRSEQALMQATRARELDPLSLIVNANLAQVHYYGRRFQDTMAAAQMLRDVEPGFAVGRFWLGAAHAANDNFAEAITEYEAFAAHGGGRTRALALIAHAQARSGQGEAARRTLEELRAHAARQPVAAFHFVLAHVGLGERDEAFAWLEKAYQDHDDQLAYLGVEPLLDPLRSDPRFDTLLRRLRLPFGSRIGEAHAASAPDSRERRSLAVLPFRDLTGDPASAHLGLSLADATITELAQLGSLLVRPTSAILGYRNRPIDALQAARQLGVDAIVDGSFQREGSRLRATVRVVEAKDGRTVWAGKIDASLDDVFKMQDDVSRSVARALELKLTPAEEHRLGGHRAGTSAQAYELYLRGKLHLLNESLADFVSAVDFFERARQVDPGFALAWAGLGAAYERIGFEYHPEGDWYARAQAMCDQALQLHPDLPEALYLRGRLLWSPQARFAHADALRLLFASLRGRPNLDDAYVRLGVILYHVGLPEPGEHALRRALAISPEHLLARGHLAACQYTQGRYAESLEACLALVDRMPSYWMHYLIAHCHLKLGDLASAERAVARMDHDVPHDTTASIRVLIAALKHDDDEAERQVEQTVRHEKAYGHYHHAQHDIACAYALLGRLDDACRWLADASRNGYPCVSLFSRDTFLEALRRHPPFERLMEELRAEQAGYVRLYEELDGQLDVSRSSR